MAAPAERMNGYLTPDEAAELLRVRRETVYRSICQGKLHATRAGRRYRIACREVAALRLPRRFQPRITLREYSTEQIAAFLCDDAMDSETTAIARRFASHARS